MRVLLFLVLLVPALAWPADLRQEIHTFRQDEASLKRFYRQRWSAARLERFRRFYRETRQSIDQLAFDPLDAHGKADYILFRNKVDYELRSLDLEQRRLTAIQPLVPFAAAIVALAEARQKVDPLEARAAAATLAQLDKQVRALPAPKDVKLTLVNRAATATEDLRRTLERWFKFYDGYDPQFTWWAAEPHKKLDEALLAYRKRLSDQDKDVIVGDPVGREALLSDLQYEMIPYTPEELIEIANREFAWCDAEMRKASRELGFGDDWQKALEHVKTLHVAPGEQTQLVKKLAVEAMDFVDQRGLITVPPLARETWRMEMMSADAQKVNPFFLGGEEIRVSFPTREMTHEQKMMSMRGNNIHFSRATVFHELIPGHFLQEFHTERFRNYRQVFDTPFWIEGWCLYWEMLFWDLGFPQTPENRVGMLFWRMHRCARIIFSLRFHLEQMTPQECVAFLVDRVGHERDNAAAEVRRSFAGDYPPLYQLAYMMGAIQFRGLRRELVDTRKMTDRQFHDAVLQLNSIPVEMVRATLSGQPLTKDFRSTWRFAGR